tara:strand:+ start:3196 stop:4575 length:1380 start_codon:yes stop_codon:yes gene_type:complete
MADALQQLIDHALDTPFSQIPPAALACARKFLLDSVGVGVSGSNSQYVAELLQNYAMVGRGDVVVWGTDATLSPPLAAFMNAFQIHNAEFDCVHEQAVVHPMAVLLGTLSGVVAVAGHRGRAVNGEELLTAITVGVDVAANLGVASKNSLSFFRPATAGAFAATIAGGRLLGLDRNTVRNAVGITLGQLGGTMQAHTEGSSLLAMQVGFNARNAVFSLLLAADGIPGPQDALEGPYGYFPLFEGEHDLASVVQTLGNTWRVTEVAHKPFPSGRATHGMADACMQLRSEHQLSAADVAEVDVLVPSLTERLVGRPAKANMQQNYARLSGAYVCATALAQGDVTTDDFRPQALADEERLQFAQRINIRVDDNPDPNALTPIAVTVHTYSGDQFTRSLTDVYGSPANPMTEAAYLAKFRHNMSNGRCAFPDADATTAELEREIATLEEMADVNVMFGHLGPT